jgi:uncharacterized membrane protein HdeD (DUF308 family)
LNALKQPGWLRGLEIVTGLLAILFGVIVLAFPGLGVATLVVVLSIGLIFAGIRSISIMGFSHLSKGLRMVSAIAGIVSLILAIIVILFPGYGALTLMILLAYGLIVYGFSRIFLAYTLKSADGWLRGVIAAVGVLDIILSVVVIALPDLALLTLTVMLSLVLLVSGVEILVSGVVGRTWLGNIVKVVMDDGHKN